MPVNSKRTVTGQELGASEMSTLLGHGYGTPNDVLKRHVDAQGGKESVSPPSDVMKFGLYCEDGIRKWVEDELDVTIESEPSNCDTPGVMRNPEVPGLGASLDGLLHPTTNGLTLRDWYGEIWTIQETMDHEIKTAADGDTALPMSTLIQAQAQLLCANLEYALVTRLPRNKPELQHFVITRHAPTIDAIIEAVADFWQRVEKLEWYPPQTPKEVEYQWPVGTHREVVPITDDTFDVLLQQYYAAKQQSKAIEKTMEGLELQLKQTMQDYEQCTSLNGYTCKWTTVTRKAQPEKVVPAQAESTYRRFSVQQPKGE